MKKIRFSPSVIIGLIVFAAGLLDIFSAFHPVIPARIIVLEEGFPLAVRHASKTLSVLSGFFLLFLARGIWNKKRRAWFITVSLLAASLVFHIIKGFDVEDASLTAIPLILLVAFRFEFTIASARLTLVQRARRGAVLFLLLGVYSTAGYFLLQGQFTRPISWHTIVSDYIYTITGLGSNTLVPLTHQALWFQDSITAISILVLLSIVAILFGPDLLPSTPTEAEQSAVLELARRHGSLSTAYLSLMPDKRYFFTQNRESVVAYKIRQGTAVALGDPLGPEGARLGAIEEFYAAMQQRGLSVVFYLVAEHNLGHYKSLGMKALKVGDDAAVQTAEFNLNTPAMKNVRNAAAAARRSGLLWQWHRLSEVPWLVLSQIETLHHNWLTAHNNRSMGFSTHYYPFPPLDDGWLLAGSTDGKIVAAFSYYPYDLGTAMALDLMLKSPLAPSGTVEAAFCESIEYFKNRDCRQVSLGLATRETESPHTDSQLAQKAVDFLYKNFNQLYHYQSLAAFKAKFHPVWQPRFLIYPGETELPKIAVALAQAHMT